MRQEYIGLPGTFTVKTSGTKQVGLDFSRIFREELRANGYPTIVGCDVICEQPNICDLLADCGGISGLTTVETILVGQILTTTVNGIADTVTLPFNTYTNGLTLTGSDVELGGTLQQSTTITAPTTFDLEVVKDNVRFKVDNTGFAAFGNGESASFLGDNGTLTARTGVYTDAFGNPAMGAHANNTSTGIYQQFYLNPQTDSAFLKVGRVAPDEFMLAQLTVDRSEFGYQTNAVFAEVKLVVEKVIAPTVATVIKLVGLSTFANDGAAAAALPQNSLWRDSTNNIKIVP